MRSALNAFITILLNIIGACMWTPSTTHRRPSGSIKVSTNIMDLVGIGEEWLLSTDGSKVIAVFQDGSLVSKGRPRGSTTQTLFRKLVSSGVNA